MKETILLHRKGFYESFGELVFMFVTKTLVITLTKVLLKLKLNFFRCFT